MSFDVDDALNKLEEFGLLNAVQPHAQLGQTVRCDSRVITWRGNVKRRVAALNLGANALIHGTEDIKEREKGEPKGEDEEGKEDETSK